MAANVRRCPDCGQLPFFDSDLTTDPHKKG